MRVPPDLSLQARALVAARFGLHFPEDRQADFDRCVIEATRELRLPGPEAFVHSGVLESGTLLLEKPELDGRELCRRIRATRTAPYRYVILLTAHSGREEYLLGMEAGADDFLTKPFDPEQLAARLRVAERILGLERDVAQLSGLLPIYSYCRRIRDAGDDWVALEAYVVRHTEADFTHGICPGCLETRARPEIDRFKASRGAK